jgi:hypothetical protein
LTAVRDGTTLIVPGSQAVRRLPAAVAGEPRMFDDPKKPEAYRGPERRKTPDRRQGHDRRDEICFDLTKEDRRSGKDRRKRSGWDTIR